MRTLAALVTVATLAACWQGCSRREGATPRRRAFPRIEVADTVYRRLAGVEPAIEVNASAAVAADSVIGDGSRWLTLTYPQYPGAKLYMTVTPVADARRLREVLDNRAERMALNSGGNTTELTELTTAGGFNAQLLVTPAGTVTPVQFLAYDSAAVVTGAFFLPGGGVAAADSLAPVIEAVKTDMLHTLSRLTR